MLYDKCAVILHDECIKECGHTACRLRRRKIYRQGSIQQSVLDNKLNNMNLMNDYCSLLPLRLEVFGAYVIENVYLVLINHGHGG